jgi:hypothetical protein
MNTPSVRRCTLISNLGSVGMLLIGTLKNSLTPGAGNLMPLGSNVSTSLINVPLDGIAVGGSGLVSTVTEAVLPDISGGQTPGATVKPEPLASFTTAPVAASNNTDILERAYP